jgi:hypothetical protein
MVQAESLSSKAEALEVRGRPKQRDNYHHHNNRDKSKTDRGRSKSKGRDKFCMYCKKSNHNIDDCWKLQNKEKRNETYQPKNNEGNVKVSVASGKGKAIVVAGSDSSDGECLAVLVACDSRDDEWIFLIPHVRFIFDVTRIGSVLMSLCRLEILCVWELTTSATLLALVLFRPRPMMG